MVDSRILTTRNLVNALLDGNAKVLCSTSAVGYYGHQGDEKLTEEHPPGDDFLARLAVDWEKALKSKRTFSRTEAAFTRSRKNGCPKSKRRSLICETHIPLPATMVPEMGLDPLDAQSCAV
jgi:hypothetical protein